MTHSNSRALQVVKETRRHIHAAERDSFQTLYPVYGFIYALARRESIIYPSLKCLLASALVSAVASLLALTFVTPVAFTILKLVSFGTLPSFLCAIPALAIAILTALAIVCLAMRLFERDLESNILEDVTCHEELPRLSGALSVSTPWWVNLAVLGVCILLATIPVAGVFLSLYVRGVTHAVSFVLARLKAQEKDLSAHKKLAAFAVFRLQLAGILMALIEMVPVAGVIFVYSDLVAKALYITDALTLSRKEILHKRTL